MHIKYADSLSRADSIEIINQDMRPAVGQVSLPNGVERTEISRRAQRLA